jgi:hypothetical protein
MIEEEEMEGIEVHLDHLRCWVWGSEEEQAGGVRVSVGTGMELVEDQGVLITVGGEIEVHRNSKFHARSSLHAREEWL